MRIVVLGLWHLGCVTAACCAEKFKVVGVDQDSSRVQRLREGRAPIAEAGLDELIQAGLASGNLEFSDDYATACAGADVLWVCEDTPVNASDIADTDFVINQIVGCLPHLPATALVLVSSQLPAGSALQLGARPEMAGRTVAVSPENLQLGQALKVFRKPERIICGVPDPTDPPEVLQRLFAPFSSNIIWMLPASAEMTKSAINGFLALSIAFMNEVARLCEHVGADAKEVERGLKSEARIGPKAYLAPGGAFAGGTLARDVQYLSEIGTEKGLELIPAIKRSNDRHREWEVDRLREITDGRLEGQEIAVLGLAYKVGTDTLRRSRAVELAQNLIQAGAKVRLYDPVVKPEALASALPGQTLAGSLLEAVTDAHAVVVYTAWPEILDADWAELIENMESPRILDANRALASRLSDLEVWFEYYAVGGGLNAKATGAPRPAQEATAAPVSPDLTGKRIIVTGGSQGFGKVVVEHLLRAGASVVFCSRTEADVRAAEADLKPYAVGIAGVDGVVADVSKVCDAQDLVEHAITRMGGVDVVINNAGIYGPIGLAESIDIEEWQKAMEVNVYGVLHVSRAVIPHLRERGKGGSIINISGGGATSPMPRFSAYAASKAALVRLTETLALELADAGVTVNAIAPGAMHTRMIEQVIQAGPEQAGADFHARNTRWASGEATPPELGARLCLYLASDAARGITGRLLSAQWDPWETLHEHENDVKSSDIYTLRRITPKDRGFTWDPKAGL